MLSEVEWPTNLEGFVEAIWVELRTIALFGPPAFPWLVPRLVLRSEVANIMSHIHLIFIQELAKLVVKYSLSCQHAEDICASYDYAKFQFLQFHRWVGSEILQGLVVFFLAMLVSAHSAFHRVCVDAVVCFRMAEENKWRKTKKWCDDFVKERDTTSTLHFIQERFKLLAYKPGTIIMCISLTHSSMCVFMSKSIKCSHVR